MKIQDLLESKSTPLIVIDIQPEYSGMNDGDENPIFQEAIQFTNSQTGKVLMFVNAERDGLTSDTITDIKIYWEDSGFNPDNWNRVEVVDKGYGYFRTFMDNDVSDAAIIRLIRYMYQSKKHSTNDMTEAELQEIFGTEYEHWMTYEHFSINWTSVAKLKEYSGAYLYGGGRNECLKEVTLLMNAFNIKYKLVERLIYG